MLNKIHKYKVLTVEKKNLRKNLFSEIRSTKNSNYIFSTFLYRKESFSPHYMSCNSFSPINKKLRCITIRAIKICTANCVDLELDNISKIFLSLGYPETVIKKTIKATQSKINCLSSFGPHPCPVYLHLPYMGKNSIRLAKQASLVIKSTFLNFATCCVQHQPPA